MKAPGDTVTWFCYITTGLPSHWTGAAAAADGCAGGGAGRRQAFAWLPIHAIVGQKTS